MITFMTENEGRTQALAAQIAPLLSAGDVICLSGPLGAGKSVFARALIRAYCGDPALSVPSPTFTVLQNYESPAGALFHFDLYRLEKPEELDELGWDDALYDGIAVIEWPERLGSRLPAARLEIKISLDSESARTITITGHGKEGAALEQSIANTVKAAAAKMPRAAMILAAGMGTRLRPYTDTMPKPMVQAGGKALIDYALAHLAAAGVENVTVNLHYRAAQLAGHLQTRSRPEITLSQEDTLLDTGGGIKKALATLGDRPFFVVSGDSLWTDGTGESALARLAAFWNPDEMDILILLQPLENMKLTKGAGDYDLLAGGRAVRRADKSGAYMWTSIRLCQPSIFEGMPDEPFSFLALLDETERKGRLYGLVHDGEWHHISTPQDLESVNASLSTLSDNMAADKGAAE